MEGLVPVFRPNFSSLGDGPFTVFAPTDAAFAGLVAATGSDPLEDPPLLQSIVLYHVVPGKFITADLATLQAVGTLFGEPVTFTPQGGGLRVSEGSVIASDIEAANGVIHVIDKVLLPPTVTVGATGAEAAESGAAQEASEAGYDTAFPLPADVQNFMGQGGESQIDFHTSLTLEDLMEFYRTELANIGLTEYPVLTVAHDTMFSMVFQGREDGQVVVVQSVNLGELRNINMRLEDAPWQDFLRPALVSAGPSSNAPRIHEWTVRVDIKSWQSFVGG